MRQIKFRVWDKLKKRMLDSFGLWELHDDGQNLEHGNGSIFVNRRYNLFKKKDFLFLQFTGLKDKNGKKIYEGDVIKCLNKSMEIKFMNAQFIATDGKGIYTIWTNDDGDIEVLGNIYENPLLVKKSK